MEDFIGRTLKEGDIVWVVNDPKHAEIGVVLDDSIRTMKHIRIKKSSGCVYLLENPTLEEKKRKSEIMVEYQEYLDEKRKKQQIRNKQKKEYGKLVGGIYSDTYDNQFLYLGNLNMHIYNEEGEELETKSGNCYLEIPYKQRIKDGNTMEDITMDTLLKKNKNLRVNDFSILKGFKTIDGFLGVHPDFKKIDYYNILGEEIDVCLKYAWDPTIRKSVGIRGTIILEK